MTGLVPVLTAQGMRGAESATFDDWGVPARLLMEVAGRAAADVVSTFLTVEAPRVAVLCGPGNNGGDGLVVARVLHARGVRVVALTMPSSHESAGRKANRLLAERLARDTETLLLVETPGDLAGPFDAVVDAILGTGATGDLRDSVAPLTAWMNAQTCPVVALDVPTGVDATTGKAAEGSARADVTVAFGAAKAGLLVGDGAQHAGRVVAVEIGVPIVEIEQAAVAHMATDAWVRAALPRRGPNANKYSAGKAVTVVGSRAFTGAAVLSSTAALRAGAGAVVCCTPLGAQATVDAHSAEVMVEACPETSGGALGMPAFDPVSERLDGADAALVGCGLGRAPETARLVRALVRRARCPLVLDADGLRAFAGHGDAALAERAGGAALVLTPHLGELRALVGDDAYDPDDRLEAVRGLAQRWNAVVVFKGMPSVVGCPDGRVLVGPPGVPALATAGSGDTLAGVIVAFLAQGLAAPHAALCALHVGSEAARIAGGPAGVGVVASDLVAHLPAALAHFLA